MPKGIPKNGVNTGRFTKGHQSVISRAARIRVGLGNRGEKHGMWKGDGAKYNAIHEFVRKWKGQPKLCEGCGSTKKKKYEWANVDHKYRRVLEDYIRMCTSCHYYYDKYKKLR